MTIRNSTKDIDLGFGIYDSERTNNVKVQLLIPRQPPKEQQIKYCSKCNLKIEWLPVPRRFICYSCGITYSELDTPLSSIDQQIRPLQSSSPYESIQPEMVSRKINRRLQGESINKHIQVTGTYRRATIHVDGPPLVSEDTIRRELGEESEYGY